MREEMNEITQRIITLRDACGYTQEEFAAELKMDVDTYKEYEKSGDDIPISVIYKIANVCGVDFAEIFTGVTAKLDTYQIVRAGEGKMVSRFPGYKYEDLAHRYRGKIMQPLLVELDPSDEPADLVCHSGQEFNMVIDGEMELVFDNQSFILSAGDTIYFNPEHPHGQRCAGDKPAKFLTVIAE